MTRTRRSVLTSLLGASALALTACSADEPAPAADVTTTSGPTPRDHPAGLKYGPWLRPSSHLLDVAGTRAVLVEFLDFECGACAGVYPWIERLRNELKGRLTFGVRYFPLDGHVHARPAAQAVEAAARQGKLQQMYEQLYANQKVWKGKESVDSIFAEFADVAGLDVDRWQRDRRSASVRDRVLTDLADAKTLALQGAPAYFLNGAAIKPKDYDDLKSTVSGAAA